MKLTNSVRSDFSSNIHKKVASKNPQKLWQGLNEVLGRKAKSSISSITHFSSGIEVTELHDTASLFNKVFANNFSPERPEIASQFVE
jgi:hypothetical protein